MGLSEWFGFSNVGATSSDELPELFPVAVSQNDFVRIDVLNIFQKILTDVLERTGGIPDEKAALLWDNCLKSESGAGLVTILALAMSDKADLFLVYDAAVNVVRLATSDEQAKIRKDYETQADSQTGMFVSFKNYIRSDMVKFYCGLEYCTVSSLFKQMNLSKAVQLKISDLRASTSLVDSADAKKQATTIADGLARGKAILLDAKDSVETAVVDMEATKESMSFLGEKKSFYLGMPDSYLTGEQTGGLGTTGENDTKAIERGLKNYYFSILKPVLEKLFGIKTTYKSQDFRQIAGAMDVLKTFNITDDTIVSADNKRVIMNALLDLPADAKGDPAPRVEPMQIVAPGAPAVADKAKA